MPDDDDDPPPSQVDPKVFKRVVESDDRSSSGARLND